MMKKAHITPLILTCLLSNTAFASWEGSFLVGLSGGWNSRHGTVDTTITHPTAPVRSTSFTIDGSRTYDDGFLWGLLAGYELYQNHWILGLEANLDWQDKRHKNEDNMIAFTDTINQGWEYTPHYKTNAVLGFTARVAYELFENFIPYVRIGPEFSSNRLEFYGVEPTQGLFVAGDTRRYMIRLLAAAGVQIPMPFVMPGLSFRAEYNYHSRGKEIDCAGLASPDFATLWNINTKPYTDSVKASIVWDLPF